MDKTKDCENTTAEQETKITWDKNTEEQFRQMIAKIPIFLRGIAEQKVSHKAENLAKKDNRTEVSEKDMVDAFFLETPFGFHGPMKLDMEAIGLDYIKYGYQR